MEPKLNEKLTQAVKRAQKKDAQAYSEIVRLTQDRIFRFCIHLTGNSKTAEELAQDTFHRALTKIDLLKEPGAFMGWIYQIARNLFYRTQEKAEAKLEKLTNDSNPDPLLDELKNMPEANPTDIELFISVQQALLSLTSEEREILVLVDQAENSYQEAADLLGLKESTLRARLMVARKKFHDAFSRK